MSSSRWIAFTPRDTLVVRDGRQFDAGADATAEAVQPGPSTLAGAVYAAYGGVDPEPDAVRGPVMAQRSGDQWMPLFPVPADLVRAGASSTTVRRLRPAHLTVETDLSDDCPQWLVGDGEPLVGWVDRAGLEAYLSGGLFVAGQNTARIGKLRMAKTPLVAERRVGLARTADRVARIGYLYQSGHLRARDGVGLLAECDLPDGWNRQAQGPVPLGGRGRLVDVSEPAGVSWPTKPVACPGGRVLVYVATPAIWPQGWRIRPPDGARLVAAAVGPAEPVATSSPRGRDPRALRWAVPAGSVYLLRFDNDDQDTATRWARNVHGTAYGRGDDDRLRTAGFGVILTGVWE